MAEKPKNRPPTPKRLGPNTIVRYPNRFEEIEEIVKKMREQELEDSQQTHTKVKSVRRFDDSHHVREFSIRKRFFGSKSPKRPPTPKREQHGPHAIKVDKRVEKAIKKHYKREHPDMPYPGDLATKGRSEARRRPPTPKKEQTTRNAVILNEDTREVVRKHLEENDLYYNHPGDIPKLHNLEVDEGTPRMGQVSPMSPTPTPSPLSPTDEDIKKSDSKFSVQEALLTAGKVGTVAFPAASTAKPRIEEDEIGGGFSGFIRTFSGKILKKKRSLKKKVEPEPEPVSDLSVTDTSVHTSLYSTSLGSELFEDRGSETYTPSTVTPGTDMSFSRLEELNREYENLSDSFPSEVEGAVGGIETEPGYSSPEQPDLPSVRLPKYRSSRKALETWEEDPDDDELPRYRKGLWSQELTPEQRKKLAKKLDLHASDAAYWDSEDSGFRDIKLPAKPGGKLRDRTPRRLLQELRVDEWNCDDTVGQTFGRTEMVTYSNAVLKKGVLQTPDGDFVVDYLKKPNNELLVVRTHPLTSSGTAEEVTSPSSEPADEPSVELGMHRSDLESEYHSSKHPHRKITDQGRQAGRLDHPSEIELDSSRSSSGSDSDSDIEY